MVIPLRRDNALSHLQSAAPDPRDVRIKELEELLQDALDVCGGYDEDNGVIWLPNELQDRMQAALDKSQG